MKLLPNKETVYLSMDSVADLDEAVNFLPELLNRQNPPGLPRHILALKVDVPVNILRNLGSPRLCNGTRAVVTHMYRNSIAVRILKKFGLRRNGYVSWHSNDGGKLTGQV